MTDIKVPVNLETCISSSLDFLFSSTGAIHSLGLALEGSINFRIPSDRLQQSLEAFFGNPLKYSGHFWNLRGSPGNRHRNFALEDHTLTICTFLN